MTPAGQRAGVLGHPIGHSLSPVLHRAAYQHLGLDWNYDAYDVTEEQVAAFVTDVDLSWAGLSLTMPLKVAAVPLMDFLDPAAKLTRAVNTVLVHNMGGVRQLVGANTDVRGIVSALRESGRDEVARGVVIGGGATATSAAVALRELGAQSLVAVVRNRAKAGGLMRTASQMGMPVHFVGFDELARAVKGADAVVSTVPAAVGEQAAQDLPLDVRDAHLLDVVYHPLVTPLAAAWRERGGVSIGGERMLLHQAAGQVQLMTGRTAPVEAMDAALRGALQR
jgi:shikimate dehydrogenase